MKYKIIVNCTKEHLEKAKYCNLDPSKVHNTTLGQWSKTGNCWIAIAVQDIFPLATISNKITNAYRYNSSSIDKKAWEISLPTIAQENIIQFDGCHTLEEREALEPFSFEIEFDQQTLDTIMECNGFACMQDFSNKISTIKHLEFSEC